MRIAQRDPDSYLFDAVDQHDIARFRLLDDDTLKSLEHQHLVDLGHPGLTVRAVHHSDLLSGTNASAGNAADANTADEA